MIRIFASYTHDYIAYNKQVVLGGPAYYLEKILHQLGSEYMVSSGEEPGKVSIYKNENGDDFGRIDSVYPIKVGNIESNTTPVIVSTIHNEIDLNMFHAINVPLFIDIQGFIRDKNGGKNNRHLYAIGKDITVYKCTGEEFGYINPELGSLAGENNNIYFIVTHGGYGIDIYNGGILIKRIEEERIQVVDTIGAGDVFLGACVHHFDQGNDLIESVRFGSKQARLFLERKCYFLAKAK